MGHINIEIKARTDTPTLDKVRDILKMRDAHFRGLDYQIDTYFKVSSGRLKLREGTIGNYLIHYEREDQEGPKQSNVILYKSEPHSSLKEVLMKALGVLVVVDKQREIYFIDNVKFHLDAVKYLGNFVEIEAIDKAGNIGREKLLERCNFYRDLLGILPTDLISVSYSDLLLRK